MKRTLTIVAVLMSVVAVNTYSDEGDSISFDFGVLHGEIGTIPGPDGIETTIVEGGFRTVIYDEQMRVEDTSNPDGSRKVETTRERSFLGGVIETQDSTVEYIPAPLPEDGE